MPASSAAKNATSPTSSAGAMTPRNAKASVAGLKEVEPDRILIPGQPNLEHCDNKVISARYTAVTFLPVAIMEQFRRFANLYFLIVGFIMAIGTYTSLFESAISPWTTLGPLSVVVLFSLIVEGSADLKRHRNDAETNNAPCVILRRADELEADAQELDKEKAKKKLSASTTQRDPNIMKGKDCKVPLNKSQSVDIAYQRVPRKDIRQGHFVLIKNREMVPADILLLASSNDNGSAYIETSSIDGETNLKLRACPRISRRLLKMWRGDYLKVNPNLEGIAEGNEPEADWDDDIEEDETHQFETINSATKRLTRFSYLGYPAANVVYEHPDYLRSLELQQQDTQTSLDKQASGAFGTRMFDNLSKGFTAGLDAVRRPSSILHVKQPGDEERYIAALTTEPPNPSVHTFSGKLTLPPFHPEMVARGGSRESYSDIPLDAENVLLRGAVLRNTEWAIGLAFFTGPDTKLVQNSFKTPSKFSQLDQLMNKTVIAILCIMFVAIVWLATKATIANNQSADELFYIGYNSNASEPWPYLPNLDPPKWQTAQPNWLQLFFLYVTLLNNFVPLSLYITVELITFCMLWFVYVDLDMYDPTTNTRAVARSTIVTDLGRIQYIFSDKTGTLTQNVMRFKRCSVDGLAFGAPIEKTRPKEADEEEEELMNFYPLRQLLVGQFKRPRGEFGLEGLGGTSDTDSTGQTLTFNAEMFLRVMGLCHTVVVEKDIDQQGGRINSGESHASNNKKGRIFGRKRTNTSDSIKSNQSSTKTPVVIENIGSPMTRTRLSTGDSTAVDDVKEQASGPDGAPYGYAYQAESPDEGALVSAASKTYGFQVINRDSSGIRIQISCPSHLQIPRVTQGLKNGSLSLKRLAAESAAELDNEAPDVSQTFIDSSLLDEPRVETWTILAVNKFDSDRKRMSILLRSPPELGNLPILFCKGADSAMLDPEICHTTSLLSAESRQAGKLERPNHYDVHTLTSVSEGDDQDCNNDNSNVDEDEWEMSQILGLQSHLGDFASEGLRTLVLGMRVLSENECSEWLDEYTNASTATKGRAELLTKVAMSVERNLHIVGATAIEDRLQTNVPQTISTLAKAGIKLWVLTGDKRETAIEIGYSTRVLSPKMHLTEVADNGKKYVRTQMAMEFIRLVKLGKLVDFQHAQLDDNVTSKWKILMQNCMYSAGKLWRSFIRGRTKVMSKIYKLVGWHSRADHNRDWVIEDKLLEKRRMKLIEERRLVRECADSLVRKWIDTEEGGGKKVRLQEVAVGDSSENMDELSLTSEETPGVFNRASSAKSMLKDLKSAGKLSSSKLRELSLAQLTVKQASESNQPLVDEDTLSMESFFPGNKNDLVGDFDERKRTVLERLFAIDREVRKGRLKKHMTKARLAELVESKSDKTFTLKASEGPRALVIEGAALKHLLGDKNLETILFSVAKSCDAIIACRVSPKQKALLLNLVRNNVKPEPITLAIGDGANDVGMIQEAHVGVGISGKEGKQAVNASDFAISQFRFLEDLILIHGRWNFFRLSTVVFFSFYKNAILAGVLICYSQRVLYSGTPLFDEWLIAMFNFVAGLPIIILGLFDRYLSKEYVKNNPEVYKATRENELITKRTLLRWVCVVFLHTLLLYYLTVPQQSSGGGMTSAWRGLMSNDANDTPGDGEGGDLKSVGTVTFSCLIILLAYKVLFESKSLVHGCWPPVTCRKDVGEGVLSRLAYTWVGIIVFSLLFYLFAITIYSSIGLSGPGTFSQFTLVAYHVFCLRSLVWIFIIFVPVTCMAFDVIGKVFSNMFFPTQTQIHLELEAKGRSYRKERRRLDSKVRAGKDTDMPSPQATALNEL